MSPDFQKPSGAGGATGTAGTTVRGDGEVGGISGSCPGAKMPKTWMGKTLLISGREIIYNVPSGYD